MHSDALGKIVRIVVVVVIAIILLSIAAVAVITPILRAQREDLSRAICANNLKQLVLGLEIYNSVKRGYPPPFTTDVDGKPLQSWRTLILPYCEQNEIFEKINLNDAWDSPQNIAASRVRPDIYGCPSDQAKLGNETSYVAIVGPNTIWRKGQRTLSREITDSRGDTILLVEMPNSGIPWSDPRDLDLDNLPKGITKQNLL